MLASLASRECVEAVAIPWQLILILGCLRHNWNLVLPHTASKDFHGPAIWLGVVLWDLEEVLCDLEFACVGQRNVSSRFAGGREVQYFYLTSYHMRLLA